MKRRGLLGAALAAMAAPFAALAAKRRRVIRITAYGASPLASGAVNSAALEAAIAAASPGDAIDFAGGCYELDRPIRTDRPVTISNSMFKDVTVTNQPAVAMRIGG